MTEGSRLSTNDSNISLAVLHSKNNTNPDLELACNPIQQNVTNKLVLVKRGGCDYGHKALNVQNAGGIGLLVYNDPGKEALSLNLQSFSRVRIPIGSLSGDNGEALAQIYQRTKYSSNVSVKISTQTTSIKTAGLMSE